MYEDHKGRLSYTTNDDGIWLECNCSFKINLGFDPSPQEVATKWLDHIDNLDYEDDLDS